MLTPFAQYTTFLDLSNNKFTPSAEFEFKYLDGNKTK